ncbi:MAG: hypothetical protein P1V97_17845 [Planctomycetota bacterium]|nr:hypothetical protein [Planctomycetota bacterium]
MTARTLKAVCFTLALTSSAICIAQQAQITKEDVKKTIAQAEKRSRDCTSAANGIRVQGRQLNKGDYTRIKWFEDQRKDVEELVWSLKKAVKRPRFSFSTYERQCFDKLRNLLARKNRPPLSVTRLDKSRKNGKLRPLKVKKTRTKPAAKKELSNAEKELQEIHRRRERVKLELQVASANEEVQRFQQTVLTARLERSRYEAAHEEWEMKLVALEKAGKATEVAKLEIKVKQASLLRSISKYRKEELEAEYYMLNARKTVLSAQANIEKWEREHSAKVRLFKVEVGHMANHWVAAKLQMTKMDVFEKELDDLFKWCAGKKLNAKGPVVSYYPRFFDGAKNLDKLGLGVILSGKVEASKDKNYAVESVKGTRVLSIHIRGPYEQSMQKLGEVMAILKKKKLTPLGPLVVYYHSDPSQVEAKDLHTEISIPVEED